MTKIAPCLQATFRGHQVVGMLPFEQCSIIIFQCYIALGVLLGVLSPVCGFILFHHSLIDVFRLNFYLLVGTCLKVVIVPLKLHLSFSCIGSRDKYALSMSRRLLLPLAAELIHLFWGQVAVIQDVEHALVVMRMYHFIPFAPVSFLGLAYVLVTNLVALFVLELFCQCNGKHCLAGRRTSNQQGPLLFMEHLFNLRDIRFRQVNPILLKVAFGWKPPF